MNKINTFTSTGSKLIHHPEVIELLKRRRIPTPISLQIAPTSRCNLKCVFCSNVNRDKHEDLDPDRIMAFVFRLEMQGAKTVEWTGGGDPLMYEHIEGMIEYCRDMKLEQGMITNGLLLKEMDPETFKLLKWIRISMNALDYMDWFDIPDLPPNVTLGFSYVINEKTTEDTWKRMQYYVQKCSPTYVRVVPNCQCTEEEQIHNNFMYTPMINNMGHPYFYQPKMFNTPKRCYWGNFKPFLLHDGYVYPCSSVVLNEEAERSFHSKYRWMIMEDFEKIYDSEITSFPTENCSHCVFEGQNDGVDEILNPTGMENFI